MDQTKLPQRISAAGPALILLATALVFVPVKHLPSFDVPKLAFLVAAGAALCLVIALRRGAPARDPVADPILAIPALLTIVAFVGAFLAWPRGSLAGPVTALACIALARTVARASSPARAVRVVALAAAAAAAIAGGYALAQRGGFDFTPWAERREVVSSFGNTSFAAEFQAAALPLSLLLLVTASAPPLERAVGALGAALGLAHLVLAQSRIDYVAIAAASVAAACVLLVARGRTRAAAVVAVSGLVLGCLVATAFVMVSRGEGPEWLRVLGRSDTVAVRTGVWKGAAKMVADGPLRVAGPSFVDLFPAWRDADEYRISLGRRVDTPHDDYLEIAVALGVPGLIAAIAVLALLARRILAAAREHVAACAALGACIAALAVSALASSPMSHPATALLLAFAAGLVVGLDPRPLPIRAATRAGDVILAAALLVAFWPGPALANLRSDGFLALARQDVANGNAKRALSLLDDAAAIDGQAFDARFELGALLTSAGRSEEAIAAFRSARTIRPGDFDCVAQLAYALRDAGRRAEADALLDEALARCPWQPMLLAARAILALESGRDDVAVAASRGAAAALPGDPRLQALAAQASLPRRSADDLVPTPGGSSDRCLDALLALHRAHEVESLGANARAMVRRDPTLLVPLLDRAQELVPTDADAAAALVLAAASGVREDGGFLDSAARILGRAGRPAESRVMLGRALGVRARAAFLRGDDAKALKFAEQAAERDPCPGHHLVAARAATRLGERAAALEEVGAAVASGPVDPDEIRRDPVLSLLLPDERLDAMLEAAARRGGENKSPGVGR